MKEIKEQTKYHKKQDLTQMQNAEEKESINVRLGTNDLISDLKQKYSSSKASTKKRTL